MFFSEYQKDSKHIPWVLIPVYIERLENEKK